MRRAAFTAFVLATGCGDMMADGDGRALGEDLGAFRVNATLEDTSCGPGALGSPDEWDFDIRLSREGSEIFWNPGPNAVAGHLASDGVSFSFVSQTRVEVDEPTAVSCVVVRRDTARGELDSAGPEVDGFEGELTYAFRAEEEVACLGLIGVPSGFSELPCDITYGLRADRVSD